MTAEFPLVTIITPAFNRATWLKAVIDSVLDQDYPRVEYIVLDDGSSDNTVEILKQYDQRIRWESHPNMGETRTVNKGFAMASGEIISVVNSDDPLLPGAISAAVRSFRECPRALAVYTDWLTIGPKSEPIFEQKLPQYDIRNMLMGFNVAMGPGTFFRRSAFALIGLRDESLHYTGDLDYWFRLALHGPFVHIPRTLATHRAHRDAASTSCKGAEMGEELARLAAKICADPRLPEDLRNERNEIVANAHLVAMGYCGADQRARLNHCVEWGRLIGWRGLVRYAVGKIHYVVARTFRRMLLIAGLFGRVLLASVHLMRCMASAIWLALATKFSVCQSPRFLVVSHVLPPSWSGQAVILGRLLSGIESHLYCLASISSNDQSLGADQTTRLPAPYHVIRSEHQLQGGRQFTWLARLNTHFRVFQRAVSIGHLIRLEKCSAVVVGTGDLIDPPAANLAARLTGVAFYLYVFDDYTFQWIDPIMREQARTLEYWMMGRADGLMVPNEFLAQAIRQRHGREASVVRNACAWRPRNAPADDYPGENGGLRERMLLYTGAVYQVNANTLCVVIAALERIENPTVRLHIYTAQAKEQLRFQGICGSHVVHRSHAPYAEVEQVQRTADILLIPFDFASQADEVIRTAAPGKLGDYLASGRPILAVVPADSFVAWYLRRYDCGLVVDRADADAVAEAIQMLLQDAELRQRLTANALARAVEDFDPMRAQQALLRALGLAQ